MAESHGNPYAEQEFKSLLEILSGTVYWRGDLQQIKEGTNDHKPYLAVGRELADSSQYLPAIRILRRCVEVAPGTIYAYLILARCYYQLRDEAKANILLLNALALYESYETLLIRSASEEDSEPSSLYQPIVRWLLAEALGKDEGEIEQRPI